MHSASILVVVAPEVSAFNATFRLSRILKERGHRVVYAAPQRWEPYLSQQGFQTMLMDVSASLLTAPTERHCASFVRDETRRRLRELQCRLVVAREFDLVLLHPTWWHCALVLRRLGVPYLSANTNLGSAWNLQVPPVFSSLRPCRGRLVNGFRCGMAWLGMRYFGAFAHRYRGIIPPKASNLGGWIREISIVARQFVRCVLEPLYMPVYHTTLRTARREGIRVRWGDYGYRLVGPELVFGPRAIDFCRAQRDEQRVYVGTSVDTNRVEDAFDWSRVDPQKPLVYCAIGSHGSYWNAGNRVRLLKSVVQSFRTHPEYQLLLQTAGEEELVDLGPLPDNIVAASWYPQLQVLARTSVFITHGGLSSVREALYAGVPMIVFPFGVDQPGNAARVMRARVGLRADIREVTAERISSMLQMVDTPLFRENSVLLSRAVRGDNDCKDAVAVFEVHCVHDPNAFLAQQGERFRDKGDRGFSAHG